jgi:cell division protein FtsQ
VDRRLGRRRRAVARDRGRRRGTIILLTVLVLAVTALFLWARSSSVFGVKNVLASETTHVKQADIRKVVADLRGVSLLKLSTGDLERALSSLPYVRSAEVYRRFPNTLEIRVSEYRPCALLRPADGTQWLVADDGMVLEKLHGDSRALNGTKLTPLVPSFSISPRLGERLSPEDMKKLGGALLLSSLLQDKQTADRLPSMSRIAVSAQGELTAELSEGGEVRLGEGRRLKDKLTVVSQIIEQYLRDGKVLVYVDASTPDRVVAKSK